MRKRIALASLIVTLALSVGLTSVAPPAQAATRAESHPAFLDKTRFALHMGLAYFAFHHFVWNKYKAGDFKAGAAHRTSTIIKAGIALLFTVHELKKAYDIANGSSSKTLQALVKPLNALGYKMQTIGNRFKKGQYSDADVNSLNSSANSFSKTSSTNGYGFKDIPVTIPGA